jgi:hypothetical protein
MASGDDIDIEPNADELDRRDQLTPVGDDEPDSDLAGGLPEVEEIPPDEPEADVLEQSRLVPDDDEYPEQE